MAIIGIDLGTTNSLACYWKDGKAQLIPNAFGEYLTPSVVGVDEDGSILVGNIAKERLITHPKKTVSSFKRYMGTDKRLRLGTTLYTPEELSAFVLKQLISDAEAYLGETVDEIIVSVPAYFDDNGRNATKAAGKLAGVHLDRIINEPSAAALAYKMNTDSDSLFLVVDFGGGTLDVSLVDTFENVIEIVAVSGDNHLGGNDFNEAIAKEFCKENSIDFDAISTDLRAMIIKESEKCKIALSDNPVSAMMVLCEGRSYSMMLDNKKLFAISQNLLERIKKPIVTVLKDSGSNISEIDKVILVGGSSKMPVVQQYISELLKKEVAVSGDPDTIVARGVGYVSGIKVRNEDIKDVVLADICPFSLGVNIVNYDEQSNPYFSAIIERNTALPTSKVDIFSTSWKGQEKINVSFYQGENLYCKDNIKLGEIDAIVPKNTEENEEIEVRFTYDINGILDVDVTILSTGEKINKVVLSNSIKLSEEQINKSLQQLSKIKVHPRESVEARMISARLERLYKENTGDRRDYIENLIRQFNGILARQDSREIRLARKQLQEICDRLEVYDFGFSYDEENED